MTESLDLPEKQTWNVVKFNDAVDGSLLAAFTDRDSDEVYLGVTYTSEPALEVQLAPNTGTLSNDTPTKILMPVAPIHASASVQLFLDRITSGAPYQEVDVNIAEISTGEGAPKSTLATFQGTLTFLDLNVKNDNELISFEALSDKQKLQAIRLGLPAENQCINALGDDRCQVALLGFLYNLTITNIDGKIVTCSGVPNGLGDRFFMKGYLELGSFGLRILIHNWRDEVEGDKTQFFMQERPPSHWDGEVVTAVAGCDKSIEVCRSRFFKEEQFNGWGYSMPEYHPSYEDGEGRR